LEAAGGCDAEQKLSRDDALQRPESSEAAAAELGPLISGEGARPATNLARVQRRPIPVQPAAQQLSQTICKSSD